MNLAPRGRTIALAASVLPALLPTLFCLPFAGVARGADPPAPGYAAAQPSLTPPRLGGYIQARAIGQEQVGFTAVINRARFSIDGALPSRFTYRLLVELQASAGPRNPAGVGLREAIVRWNPAPFAFTAGAFKAPFTREYLIPIPALELADLAVAIDSLAPRYDVGFMGEIALGPFATVAAGAFNGEGANSIANRDSTAMLVGRVTARPLPQLTLGASATRDGPDSTRWGADASFQQHGVVVRAEYMTRQLRGRAREKDDFGWYVFEALRLKPRVQMVARQEDFQRPAYGASRRVRGLAYGANLDLAARVRLLLEMSRRWTGANQIRSDAFIAQIQAQF